MLRIGRTATGTSAQLILTSAFGTSGTCWGLLCHLGFWQPPCWWDKKTSHCAEVTKFSYIHSGKHRGGQSVEAIKIPRTVCSHLRFSAWATAIVCSTPGRGHHTPHPHPSPCTSHSSGYTYSPAHSSWGRKDNEKIQNPLRGPLFMGKGIHI